MEKKLVSALLVTILALATLANAQSARQQERRQAELEQAKVVRSLYEAWNAGDIDALLAAFEEEGRWRESQVLPIGGSHEGAERIRERVFDRLDGDWEGWTIALDSVLASGTSTVVATGTVSAFHRESGRALWSPYVGVWTFRDALVRNYSGFLNADAYWEAARTR